MTVIKVPRTAPVEPKVVYTPSVEKTLKKVYETLVKNRPQESKVDDGKVTGNPSNAQE